MKQNPEDRGPLLFKEKFIRAKLLLPPTIVAVVIPLWMYIIMYLPFVKVAGINEGTAALLAVYLFIFAISYALLGLLFYKGPLKIYGNGIGLSISPYERISSRMRAFILYDEIVAICPAYGLFPGYRERGVLYMSGLSIRITSGEVYYLTDAQIPRKILFSYEVAWVLRTVLRERWNNLYRQVPEFSREEWDIAQKKLDSWSYRFENYVNLWRIRALILALPSIVMLFPRFVSVILLTSVMVFWLLSTGFFMGLAIWEKREEYNNFVGAIFYLQEVSAFTDKKAVPSTIRIPEYYRYTLGRFLRMSEAEWSEYFENRFPAAKLQKVLRSFNLQVMKEKAKLARLVRAERAYKMSVIPLRFRSLAEKIVAMFFRQSIFLYGKPRYWDIKTALDKKLEMNGKLPAKTYEGYHYFTSVETSYERRSRG
ncbi:MAG: hypothetical protein V3U09_08550 [Thermoplasmata archaeon]